MKRKNMSKSALTLLVTGLMMVTIVPAVGRYVLISDPLKGFLTGLGLAFEFISLVKIQRDQKNANCTNGS
ncbi:hypothetical protein ACXZ1K_12810 [Pedobacter sp. PWIIR3]